MSIYRNYNRLLINEQNKFQFNVFRPSDLWENIVDRLKSSEPEGSSVDMNTFPVEEFLDAIYRGGSSIKVVDNQLDTHQNTVEGIEIGDIKDFYNNHPIIIKEIITRENAGSDDVDDLDSVNFDSKALPSTEVETTIEYVAYFMAHGSENNVLFAGLFSNNGEQNVQLKDGWQAPINVETYNKVSHEFGISRKDADAITREVLETFGEIVGESIETQLGADSKGDVTNRKNKLEGNPYETTNADKGYQSDLEDNTFEDDQNLDQLDDIIGGHQAEKDNKFNKAKASGFGTKKNGPAHGVNIAKDINVDAIEYHENQDAYDEHGLKIPKWYDEDEETVKGIKKVTPVKNKPKLFAGKFKVIPQKTTVCKPKEEKKKVIGAKIPVPDRLKQKIVQENLERIQMNEYMKNLRYI